MEKKNFFIIYTSNIKGGVRRNWFVDEKDEWEYYWKFDNPQNYPIAFRKGDDKSIIYFQRLTDTNLIKEIKVAPDSILWLCGYRHEAWERDLPNLIKDCNKTHIVAISRHPAIFPEEVFMGLKNCVISTSVRYSLGEKMEKNFMLMLREPSLQPPVFDALATIDIIKSVFF